MRKKLRRLYYVPLEAYENRYTYALQFWSVNQFEELGVNVVVVPGLQGTMQIGLGQVLDATSRPLHALKQIEWLVSEIGNNSLTANDFILFEDMTHPGIEALFYLISQMKYAGKKEFVPKIGMRCLAQTIDPDDFVHYTGMSTWMRHYEDMVLSSVDCIFAASSEMIGYMRAAGWDVPVFVTGLPFNKAAVANVLPAEESIPFNERPKSVVFASRIAAEKNPAFLATVATALVREDPSITVTILSGSVIDCSKYPLLAAAVNLGYIILRQNLTKIAYYQALNNARVLFNCSQQDWVSNTASEADTFGCNLVFPAYRSFPEAFDNDATRLYVPWSVKDAVNKLLVATKLQNPLVGTFANRQNNTNSRTLDFIDHVIASSHNELQHISSLRRYK